MCALFWLLQLAFKLDTYISQQMHMHVAGDVIQKASQGSLLL